MDLELLRTFLEVTRTRHFGRAAEALNLTQAAVSARIKALESQLNVQVFDRLPRDIRLTPEGNRLVRHAQGMIGSWRIARQDVALAGAAEQLAVGGSPRLWDVLLQDWLHELRRVRPDVGLIAEAHSPEVLTRRLLDGLLDVAVMFEPAQLEVLEVREISTVELMLVSSSPGQAPDQAMAEGYVYVDWGLAHAVEHRRLFPDAPESQSRMAHAKMALSYILELGGSAYLPYRMVIDQLTESDLFIVEDAPVIRRQAFATYPVRSIRQELIENSLSLFN